MDPGGHEHDHADHPHEHRGVRGLLASVIGHSHDPGDAIDDALTADARGIRAAKVSLLVLAATAAAQRAIVAVSGSVALFADRQGMAAAIWSVAALTAASGLVVMIRMYETRPTGSRSRGEREDPRG